MTNRKRPRKKKQIEVTLPVTTKPAPRSKTAKQAFMAKSKTEQQWNKMLYGLRPGQGCGVTPGGRFKIFTHQLRRS